MAEPEKQQLGDGHDNYAQAAQQAAKAAKQATKAATAKGAAAAAKGAEATTKAAAAVVASGAKTGSAVAEVASGTAAGGPWGAIIAAAWAMRKTLFKVLVCICLVLVIFIVIIVSLPSLIWDYLFGTDDSPPVQRSITDIYNEMAGAVSDVVNEGLDSAMAQVENTIEENGYDHDLCMERLVNYAQSSAGFDTCYILAAYSASMGQQNTSKDDMIDKLSGTAERMFPVTYVEYEQDVTVPATYTTYAPVMVTHITRQTQTGEVNGEPQYEYETALDQYYRPSGEASTETEITVDAYSAVELILPIYEHGHIIGTRTETYYCCHVYSYGIDLLKQFSDGAGKLENVEFVVKNATDNYFVQAQYDADAKVYYVTDHVEAESDATHFIPSTEGRIFIRGLEDDIYILTEVKTDNGYSLLKNDIEIVISTADGELCEICGEALKVASATVNGKPVTMDPDGESIHAVVPLSVTNMKGFDLPKTGDRGTWMYGVLGAALVAASGLALFFALRKRKNEQ